MCTSPLARLINPCSIGNVAERVGMPMVSNPTCAEAVLEPSERKATADIEAKILLENRNKVVIGNLKNENMSYRAHLILKPSVLEIQS